MPKITDLETLALAEELIRYGIGDERDTFEATALRELAGDERLPPMSHAKASKWLGAHGHPIGRSTLKRRLGSIEQIRAGTPFADPRYGRGDDSPVTPPSTPTAPARVLPAGFRRLELDADGGAAPTGVAEEPPENGDDEAPGENSTQTGDAAPSTDERPRRRREPTPPPRHAAPGPQQAPADDDWRLPGNLLPHLIPTEPPRNRDGDIIFTLDQIRELCAAVYTSALDLNSAALYRGINPFKLRRVLQDGMSALSAERECGELHVAVAVLGHWAGCGQRAGQSVTVSAARGDVRAQKLLLERLELHAPDLDKVSGGAHEEALGFARQLRAYIDGETEEIGVVQAGRSS